MSDAATLNGAGERTVQSIQYKTVLATKDPMPKVIEYYKAKLMPTSGCATAKPQDRTATDSGRSVTFHDDSEGRPVAIHGILVNTEKASTTLVISRAATESETQIAWTHYPKALDTIEVSEPAAKPNDEERGRVAVAGRASLARSSSAVSLAVGESRPVSQRRATATSLA